MRNYRLTCISIVILTILLFSSSAWCQTGVSYGAAPQHNLDTQRIVALEGRAYRGSKYKILHIKSYDGMKGGKLQLLRNDTLIANVSLPVPNYEVKNFSITDIKSTKNGFDLLVDWGGGNWFYTRTFHFKYLKGAFYLVEIDKEMYVHDKDETVSRKEKLSPVIDIREVQLLKHMDQ